MNARVVPMAGLRFGSLVALRDVGRCSSGDRKWQFRCDCGAEFDASGYAVRCGRITTCPACSAERTRIASVRHGMSDSAEFGIWTGILTRTSNRNATAFAEYGGRGIKVCDRWRDSFEAFYADMGPRPTREHSVERRDNDGHYEPSNCYWATREQQGRNKRNNVLVTIEGVTRTMAEWCAQFGVEPATASLRRRQGLNGRDLFRTTKLTVTHAGVTDTIAGWSRRTGIKPSTITQRINQYGWPVERALTEGVAS